MLKNEVSYEIRIEPETDPYVGNCSAIDDETDAEQERWIRDQLDAGNELAWCMICVVATWGAFSGEAYLGHCSYESLGDFKSPGYFHDVKDEALAILDDRITSAGAAAEEWGA